MKMTDKLINTYSIEYQVRTSDMKIEDYRRKCKNGTVARKSQSLSM
jgi:hypothetical protein